MMLKEGEKLLVAVTGLIVLGVIMVGSASYIKGMEKFGNPMFFVKKHILFAGAGVIIMVLLTRIPVDVYKSISYPLFFISLAGLILVLIPGFGVKVHNSVRWLKVGGVSFQPAEFVKVTYAIYVASLLSEARNRKRLYSVIMVLAGLGCVFFLLKRQPDYGTAVFFVFITGIAFFLFGVDVWKLTIAGILVSGLLIAFALQKEYRQKRIIAFLYPGDYPEESFQMTQSLYAIGSGGISGKGIGDGKAKYHFLPEPHTDYIFSVIGEELGFVGVILTLFAYYVFFKAGLNIALMRKDMFVTLLVAFLTINIVFQALLHICVTVGLLPSKGMTLPFISYGGSSLISSCASTGIIFSAWKEVDVE